MKKVVWPKLSKSNDFDNYPFKYFEESVFSHVYDKEFVDSRLLECTECKHQGRTMNDVIFNEKLVWEFLNINNHYSGKGLYDLSSNNETIVKTEEELLQCIQPDGSYIIECPHGHKITIRKSTDKFYVYWAPRNGVLTGPGGCVIEKVDLYETV